jgi:tRNA(Ile2) C34 agmatinyltransferase TiaS
MIRRQCPVCGESWYSADMRPWRCESCGTELDNRNNKPLERRNGDAGSIKLYRPKP